MHFIICSDLYYTFSSSRWPAEVSPMLIQDFNVLQCTCVICPQPDLLYFIILFRFLLFKVVVLCFDLLALLLQCRNAMSLMHCYYACGVKQALQFI